jgi:trehalose-phosphatase
MSAPILEARLEPGWAGPAPQLRRTGHARVRPMQAVILELDGVLTRPRPGRPRPADADADVDAVDVDVEACQDAAVAVRRWRRGGLPCAAIGHGPDGHRVLRAAGLRDAIDVVVDGRTAAELSLHDEADVLRVAAGRLGVEPHQAVALCSSVAGVAAARKAGLGLVVGIARHADRRALADAGAQVVTHNVFAVRFPRRLPHALACRAELAAWRNARSLAVFLDYDGTLTPIVDDPAAAVLSPSMRATLDTLAERCPIAVVSGRDRADVEARVGVSDLLYVGSHGLDIGGRGLRRVPPEAARAIPEVEAIHARLEALVGGVPGIRFERKPYSLAVHHRGVSSPEAIAAIERAVDLVLPGTPLRRREGKRVIELLPAVDWDKGRAVRWIMDVLGLDPRRTFPIHMGDDETDEDAFAALAGMGAGIYVGEPITSSLADWYVRSPDEVAELLAWLEPD